MVRISCLICGTYCVGCSGRCSCGMNKNQVQQVNDAINQLGIIRDSDSLKVVKDLGLRSIKTKDIIRIVEGDIDNIVENKVNISTIISNQFCAYQPGSAREGKRAKCIKCGIPRFKNEGKICKSLDS